LLDTAVFTTFKAPPRLELPGLFVPPKSGALGRSEAGRPPGAMSIPTEWFSAADADGDGRVSGGEAVAFF